MKTVLYSSILLLALVGCRHQRSVSSSTNNFSSTTTSTTQASPDSSYIVTSTTTTTTSSSTATTTNVSAGGNDTVITNVSVGGGPAVIDTSKIYRVTVSFTSRGSGIDNESATDFENWVNNYPKHPAYDKTRWGREGETSYCLKLTELSTREQEIFVRDLRTRLVDKQLVFVEEYAECKGRKVN